MEKILRALKNGQNNGIKINTYKPCFKICMYGWMVARLRVPTKNLTFPDFFIDGDTNFPGHFQHFGEVLPRA